MAQDIANFAREAAGAPHFRTLTPKEFPAMLSSGSLWFVDFYAPWCPPCMRLLPQFRKASVLMQQQRRTAQPIHFGIIDCTSHGSLCSRFNVRSYPTTILYNGTVPHQYSGHHSPHNIVEFVKDILNPTGELSVILTLAVTGELSVILTLAVTGELSVILTLAVTGELSVILTLAVTGELSLILTLAVTGELSVILTLAVTSELSVILTLAVTGELSLILTLAVTGELSVVNMSPSSHAPQSFQVLTSETFKSMVLERPSTQIWVVDFFANWCGPCLAMAPEFRRFSRAMSGLEGVFVASVDCAEHGSLCLEQGVRSYPTVRLYRANARPYDFSTYNEYSRNAESFKRWLYSHMATSVTTLNDRTFEEMLRSSEPWLVDFFAPWCGHCHVFAPDFEDIARSLEGAVKLGKVDCQAFQWVCQGAGIGAYPTVVLYRGLQEGQGVRQSPRGEPLGSLEPEVILSHVRWRLRQDDADTFRPHKDEL
ncbi:Thioredoxin domain [Trinorchestia longiramus]|nr:Thioredoxin domain [Trinorchestia longiramus]